MTRRALDTGSTSSLPFSPAVWAGDLLFVSGQASTSATGEYVEDTLRGEFTRTMAGVEAILAAADLSLDDVVQVKAYLGDESHRAEFNELYREVFTEPYPARTTIACGIATLKVEIDVIAHAGPSRTP